MTATTGTSTASSDVLLVDVLVDVLVAEDLARLDAGSVRDDRTAGQRRADALVDVGEQVLRHGDLPDAGGAEAAAVVRPAADSAARLPMHFVPYD